MRTVTCAGLFLENKPAAAMKNMNLLIFLLFTIKAHAEGLNYSATYQECIASANGEHPSMINCLDQERDRIDTEIQTTLNSSKYDSFQLEILEEIKKQTAYGCNISNKHVQYISTLAASAQNSFKQIA